MSFRHHHPRFDGKDPKGGEKRQVDQLPDRVDALEAADRGHGQELAKESGK